ncbi:class II fumarate hydratase [bacterium]|nr:class II fumarate hydratase [bacterium]
MTQFRIEKDSMGEVQVPADAMYGAQTQRAVNNFPISGITFPRVFIRALGLVKCTAAEVNLELGLLDASLAKAIVAAATEVADGTWDAQFPIDIYQTGSGTSTNMNANEVIATRANQLLKKSAKKKVHPNDHVNMGQSSNDVIPTAIHVAAMLEVKEILLPGLEHLARTLEKRARQLDGVVKTGRTHLLDARPVRMSQELGGWAFQSRQAMERVKSSMPRLGQLALGGTAVGTGINAHPKFAGMVAKSLAQKTKLPFTESPNHMAAQASMDSVVEMSGQLKATASAFMKIANDLRWMNSGPIAGLGEIALPSLQPGSSIMPGKVNPVICESMMMVCAQVFGNDLAVTVGNERGNFQLNVMLPVIARNLLESITILGNAARNLADRAIAGFTVNKERMAGLLGKNPILVTSLNSIIGYEKGAKIAKTAYAEGRSLKEVALELTDLKPAELDRLLDPRKMTEGGIMK